MANNTKHTATERDSVAPAILTVLLLLSLAANVALGMQMLGGNPRNNSPVWLSAESTMRGTLSGEQRLASGEMAPEYDYAFGLRKNMQLSKENCVLDECFLNMDLTLPVGTLPEAYAKSLSDLALKEREIAARVDAELTIRKDSPLKKMDASQQIRTEVVNFLEVKYGLTPKASEGVALSTPTSGSKAACQQLAEQLSSLQKGYETELAKSDITKHPDLDYAYRQLSSQTKSVQLPLAQACAK